MSNKNTLLTIKEFEEACREADLDLVARFKSVKAEHISIEAIALSNPNLTGQIDRELS